MQQILRFSNDIDHVLSMALEHERYNRLFVLVDENTARLVLPRITCGMVQEAERIVISAGDEAKNLTTLAAVWEALSQGGATRQSFLLNVGGGVVTDLGGFAAATFKRGIRFMNLPTTLLAAVDAAVGGKTGINFQNLKNEIGAFCPASHVLISTCFFDTLPPSELKSGFAEMLKHAMLSSADDFDELLAFDLDAVDYSGLLPLLERSVEVKRRIVAADPTEQGLRRALNLGHTVGHAFESLALQRGEPVPHGYAVAWGLVTETVMSHRLLHFSADVLHRLARFVREHYGAFYITCDDYPRLFNFMHHDKKSERGEINCTLLATLGDPRMGNIVSDEETKIALDLYRDMMGI